MSSRKIFEEARLVPGEDGKTFELFHEASKLGRFDDVPAPNEVIRAQMDALWESLPQTGFPAIALPEERAPLAMSLSDAIRSRVTARALAPTNLDLVTVATMLDAAYGVTRSSDETEYGRAFRTTPSAGALYPLEIYAHSARIGGVRPGLYHYHPLDRVLRRVRTGDLTRELSESLVQPNVAVDAAIFFFITVMFERTTFKYGDRGYRFALIEAGHVAQNLNLVATALGLGVLNVGGFFDRQVDEIVGLDGVTHSTVYIVAVGANGRAEPVKEP